MVHAGAVMALNAKLVVLTRAQEDNQALRARLEQAGIAVLDSLKNQPRIHGSML